jgi:hypothetical protein
MKTKHQIDILRNEYPNLLLAELSEKRKSNIFSNTNITGENEM